ncbi:hypothetical protein [Paenibacillus sp. RC67]|uniref:hypothetical protein n=1 Tax=Paenibacillus sp. RC67 TaxID=3039392 RepID=UPI0024ADEE6D|nr:hypothetical protein [Paenibacillus sp. RC67]
MKPGGKVLDVAAGIGEQSIMAARLFSPHGSVVATFAVLLDCNHLNVPASIRIDT